MVKGNAGRCKKSVVEKADLFDFRSEEYMRYATDAMDALCGKIPFFELNTGAISRGYRTEAYPSNEILEYIRQGGGQVILTSDSHNTKSLCQSFDIYEKKVLEKGIELAEI